MTAPYFQPFNPRVPSAQEFATRLSAAPSAPPTQRGRPGILARLFGGADPYRAGLLDHPDVQGLGSQALLRAGLATLAASGPQAVRPSLGQVLAQGISAGQQGYEEGFQSRLSNVQAKKAIDDEEQVRSILSKYAGKTDLESMQGLLSDLLTNIQNPAAVKAADALAGYLSNAVNAQRVPAGRWFEIAGTTEDGTATTILVNPDTGAQVDTKLAPISKQGNRQVRVVTDALAGKKYGVDALSGETLWTKNVTPQEPRQAQLQAAGQTGRLVYYDQELRRLTPPKNIETRILQRRRMLGGSYTWEDVLTDNYYTPEERQFLIAAIQFGKLANYIDTGKQTNLTEIRTAFELIPTGLDPETDKAKARGRESLIRSGRVQSGRAGSLIPDDDETLPWSPEE